MKIKNLQPYKGNIFHAVTFQFIYIFSVLWVFFSKLYLGYKLWQLIVIPSEGFLNIVLSMFYRIKKRDQKTFQPYLYYSESLTNHHFPNFVETLQLWWSSNWKTDLFIYYILSHVLDQISRSIPRRAQECFPLIQLSQAGVLFMPMRAPVT